MAHFDSTPPSPARGKARQRLGRAGEDIAAVWYQARGYRVVERNWRTSSGEIDLVLAREAEVVFCEVKARSSERYGAPVEAVGPLKQARLRRLAAQWLRSKPCQSRRTVHFDVVSVMGTRVEVVRDAF